MRFRCFGDGCWRMMLLSWWLFLVFNDSRRRTTTTTTTSTTAMGFLLVSSPPPLLLRQKRRGRPLCAPFRVEERRRRRWLDTPSRHQQHHHIHAVLLPFSTGDTIIISQPQQLMMMMPSLLTVPATTTLLTPMLALGALPYGALVYYLDRLQAFPKGAVVGFAWVFLLGLCAGPAEIFTQSTYDGTSFFDCDWVHGTISSLFATAYTVANVALLLVRQQPSVVRPDVDGDGGDEQQQGGGRSAYGPALRYCTAVTSAIVAIAVAEYGRGDYGVHSPLWFGVLDHVMPSSSSSWAAIGEPANSLSVATWFNHMMELTQFQILIRSIHQLGVTRRRTTTTSARSNRKQQDLSSSSSSSMGMMQRRGRQQRSRLAWSLVPLQFANICICDFHLFYNQWAPVYLAFGLLLFVGNSWAAWTAWRLVAADEESAGVSSTNPAVDVASMVSTAGSSVAPTAIAVGSRRRAGNRSMLDTTSIVYTVKSLIAGLVGAYAVKYVSVFFLAPCFVPENNDLLALAATLVALSAMAVSVWDVRRLE